MITLIEIKNNLAIKNGFKSWQDWKNQSNEIAGHRNIPEGFMDSVAELYAYEKVKQSIKNYEKIILK